MEIELDFSQGVEKNASDYFEKSKKAKKKLQGLLKAVQEPEKKISMLQKAKELETKKPVKKRKRAWFEAFHWFFSRNGFLVVAGRSAKENEVLVKKHLEKNDLFLHADIQGGAATIIKSENKKIPESTIKEAAEFAGVFSKAWSSGLATVDVYAVPKTQVSKKAPSGEALGTGAFMIYGKRKWFKVQMKLSIGLKKEETDFIVISGPKSAIEKQAVESIAITQGSTRPSMAAKKILKMFSKKLGESTLHIDEVIRMLPSSNIGF